MSRKSVIAAGTMTRRSESWPFYDVRRQCLATFASIVALVAIIALVILL